MSSTIFKAIVDQDLPLGMDKGSLFCTGIKFDSQIFSSAAQDFSLFLQTKHASTKYLFLDMCIGNVYGSKGVQRSEPLWLPY